MNCRDFKGLLESYLSDELLAETNLQLHRHLEHCRDCREDLAERRHLRSSIRSAVRSDLEFEMPEHFRTRLTAELRNAALKESLWTRLFNAPGKLVPVMAVMVVAVLGGIFALRYLPLDVAGDDRTRSVSGFLAPVSVMAAENHKDCALKKLPVWNAGTVPVDEQAARMAETVAAPIRARFSEGVEVLHSHDCIFEGRRFSHVILRRQGHVVSVFFDKEKAGNNPVVATSDAGSIVCEKHNGMQVASFRSEGVTVFVVSDLEEPENLQIARDLFDSFSV